MQACQLAVIPIQSHEFLFQVNATRCGSQEHVKDERQHTCFSNLVLTESGGVVPKTSGGEGGATAQGRPLCALAATASREVAKLKRSTSTCTAWLAATATKDACSFRNMSSLSQHTQAYTTDTGVQCICLLHSNATSQVTYVQIAWTAKTCTSWALVYHEPQC